MSVDVQTEEGLSDFEGARGFITAIATHLALTIATEAMGINGQQLSPEVAAGAAQPSQGFLQGLGFGHRMGLQHVMHGLIGGDKGKPVKQFKAFLAQAARLADASDT